MTYIFYIVSFQADKSVIGYLHTEMTKLLILFLGKFVSTIVIRATTDITVNVDFRATNNQLIEEVGNGWQHGIPIGEDQLFLQVSIEKFLLHIFQTKQFKF